MMTPFLLLLLAAACGLLSYRLYHRQEASAGMRQWPGLLAGIVALVCLVGAIVTLPG